MSYLLHWLQCSQPDHTKKGKSCQAINAGIITTKNHFLARDNHPFAVYRSEKRRMILILRTFSFWEAENNSYSRREAAKNENRSLKLLILLPCWSKNKGIPNDGLLVKMSKRQNAMLLKSKDFIVLNRQIILEQFKSLLQLICNKIQKTWILFC